MHLAWEKRRIGQQQRETGYAEVHDDRGQKMERLETFKHNFFYSYASKICPP